MHSPLFRQKSKTLFLMFYLLIFSALSIYPVLRIFTVSLRGDNAFQSRSLALIEAGSSFSNYWTLLAQTDFLIWVKNSILISFVVTLTGVVLASVSGYALSRFQFSGRKWAMLSLITTQMFPATMLLLPFFIVLSNVGLINSYIGLFIIYASTALPFCIWQMKGYYDTIPRALEDAARLDGCTQFMTFYKVILPLAAPALVITGLFSFMASWSEYCVAAIVLQDPELYTLPLGLKSFQASLSTQWGLYAAAAMLVSLPVVIVFVFVSRYLISGLTLGSVKG